MSAEFDRYAAQYDELLRDPIRDRFTSGPRFFHQRKVEVLESFLSRHGMNARDMRWLDVGCGAGDLLELGQTRFKDARGCDPSEGMIAIRPHLKITRQTDHLTLPFANAEFDLVTAVCVYHHVPLDARAALTNEIVRVLRPNGVFAMIEHNPWNPATRIIVSRTPVDSDAVLLNAPEARRLQRNAGLAELATDYFLFLPENLHAKLGAIESAMRHIPLGGQYAAFARKGR